MLSANRPISVLYYPLDFLRSIAFIVIVNNKQKYDFDTFLDVKPLIKQIIL